MIATQSPLASLESAAIVRLCFYDVASCLAFPSGESFPPPSDSDRHWLTKQQEGVSTCSSTRSPREDDTYLAHPEVHAREEETRAPDNGGGATFVFVLGVSTAGEGGGRDDRDFPSPLTTERVQTNPPPPPTFSPLKKQAAPQHIPPSDLSERAPDTWIILKRQNFFPARTPI